MTPPICPDCDKACRLTSGKEVYPRLTHLHEKPIWICDSCKAYCGCHPGTTNSLGTPAGDGLRKLRAQAHAVIDPLWQDYKGPHKKHMRSRVYMWIGSHMRLEPDEVHVGAFDYTKCYNVIALLKGRTADDINAWANKLRKSQGKELD